MTGAVIILLAFACGGSSDAPTDSQAEPSPTNQTATEDEVVPERQVEQGVGWGGRVNYLSMMIVSAIRIFSQVRLNI